MKEYILWLFAFVYVMEFMFVPWLIISYSPVMLFPDTSTHRLIHKSALRNRRPEQTVVGQ
jgi:hypothetical protein